jgi:hypothetical protein
MSETKVAKPKPCVFLVGTIHEYQIDDDELNKQYGHPQFKKFISRVIGEIHADHLMEEMNADVFKHKYSSARGSWLAAISRERDIPHLFIGPDLAQRKEIGVPDDDGESLEGCEKREQYWLERIRECRFYRALCVIGRKHICSFSKRLTPYYAVEIVEPSYNPKDIKTS